MRDAQLVDARGDAATRADDRHDSGLIARRLDALFRLRRRPDGRAYSLRDVASGINQAAGRRVLSHTYLGQLRSGARTDPSHDKLIALARFFGVRPTYFFDEETAGHTEMELRLLALLQDEGIREIALCAEGLSPETLATAVGILQKFRDLEGLGDPARDTPDPAQDSTP